LEVTKDLRRLPPIARFFTTKGTYQQLALPSDRFFATKGTYQQLALPSELNSRTKYISEDV